MDNFWPTLTAAAATLTGFTLAGYSIYITRAEMAASDPICRQYNFKECASGYSLSFMLFALILFINPLILGLLELSPSFKARPALAYFLIVFCVVFIAVVITLIIIQVRYLYLVTKYNSKLLLRKREVNKSKAQWPEIIKLGLIGFFLFCLLVVTVISLFVIRQNMLEVMFKLDVPRDWVGWLGYFNDYFPKASWAVVSLLAGLILICSYLYIFQPERFLFKRLDTTDTKEHDPLKRIEERLRKLESATDLLINTHKSVEMLITNVKPTLQGVGSEIIDSMNSYLDRFNEEILGDKPKKHLADLNIISEDFVTYDGIIWVMNGINMYAEGLIRFESGLKEIPQQLQLLKVLLHNPTDAVPTSIPSRRRGRRSQETLGQVD